MPQPTPITASPSPTPSKTLASRRPPTSPRATSWAKSCIARSRSLTARERSVVILRYGIGDGRSRTLLEVGKELSISRERVRQLEMVALAKLRSATLSQGLREAM